MAPMGPVTPYGARLAGRLEQVELESPALLGNRLGDPSRRPLFVYLPPGYDDDPARCFPVVYVLQGYAASVSSWLHAPSSFEPTYPEAADALFAAGGAPPCLVVFVDAWTSLGGSQFLDSPAVGDYRRYLVEDVVDYVDARYRTLAAPEHRGLQGKSSGGYGAIVTAMVRPDRFGAFASHAGDGAFELSLLPLVAEAFRGLRDGYGGSYERFFEEFRERRAFSKPADFSLLECYAMAACYSPGPGGNSVELPFDPASGRLVDAVWQRWLENDPVRLAALHLEALGQMRGIWLDAGRSDEHFLDVAACQLASELTAGGIECRLELFSGGHRRIEDRYPLALAFLASRLSEEGGTLSEASVCDRR